MSSSSFRSFARLLDRSGVLGLAAILGIATLLGHRAEAGVPPPDRSTCGLSDPLAGCHYLFRADGGLDEMTVFVTLRDAFDTPVPGCECSVTINLLGPIPGGGDCNYVASGGSELCSCCPLSQTAVSDGDGTFFVTYSRLGGRGTAEVCVTALCAPGPLAICCEEFVFTSPDLDGSCEAAGSSTNIIDLAIWAQCYRPSSPCNASDYNCDCVTSVLDVAVFAGGLMQNCGGGGCP